MKVQGVVEYKSLLTKAFRPNRLIRHYGCPTDTSESGLSRPGISHWAKSSSLNNGPLNQIFRSATLEIEQNLTHAPSLGGEQN